MAYNVPSISTSDISFGPGVVFMNPSSDFANAGGGLSDADVQVGSITEDGVTFEFGRESKTITQGNPRVPLFVFDQANDVTVTFTSIQWDVTRLARLLGSGVVVTGTPGSSPATFSWGGDPLVDTVGIKIQHQSASLENNSTYGSTNSYINIRVWKAVPTEGFSVQLGQDEHQFAGSFKAMYETSLKEWDNSTALSTGSMLVKVSYGATTAT